MSTSSPSFSPQTRTRLLAPQRWTQYERRCAQHEEPGQASLASIILDALLPLLLVLSMMQITSGELDIRHRNVRQPDRDRLVRLRHLHGPCPLAVRRRSKRAKLRPEHRSTVEPAPLHRHEPGDWDGLEYRSRDHQHRADQLARNTRASRVAQNGRTCRFRLTSRFLRPGGHRPLNRPAGT